MSVVDEISPREVGEDRIDLALDETTTSPQVFEPVIVNVDFSRCDPEGVVLPLELTITGPSGEVTRQYFRRTVPSQVSFRPQEGGSTLVRVAEVFHNRWFGALVVDVAGDPLQR